jgi:hypothetical protein
MTAFNGDSQDNFEMLHRGPLAYASDADWDAYYDCMALYLENPDPQIRRAALERLCMAVMRAEPMSYHYARKQKAPMPPERAVVRLRWLTALVSQAQARLPETGPAFLKHLRYHGDDEPFCGPLREWLHAWLNDAPLGVPEDLIRGALVLLGDCGGEWDEAAPRWLALLDDPSDYVRACGSRPSSWCNF